MQRTHIRFRKTNPQAFKAFTSKLISRSLHALRLSATDDRRKSLPDHATLNPIMANEVNVRVQRLLPSAQLPRYAHTGPFGDLAADLFSAEAVTLAPVGQPGSTAAVRTGLALELPSTHGALVEDRSGLALRGLTTLAGVIDPGYRGELKIVLTNLAPEPHPIAPGHRIAQLRIVERIQAIFTETDTLEEAPRGAAGFGSTGQ